MPSQVLNQEISQEMTDLINAQRELVIDFPTAGTNQIRQMEGKTLLVTGGASGFGETFVTTSQRTQAAQLSSPTSTRSKANSSRRLCKKMASTSSSSKWMSRTGNR